MASKITRTFKDDRRLISSDEESSGSRSRSSATSESDDELKAGKFKGLDGTRSSYVS